MSHDAHNSVSHEELGQAIGQEILAGLADKIKAGQPATPSDTGKFKVTGPGYAEQFTSQTAALKAYDTLKRQLRKREQAATVKLMTQAHGGTKWAVQQELKINEDAF